MDLTCGTIEMLLAQKYGFKNKIKSWVLFSKVYLSLEIKNKLFRAIIVK